MSESNVQAWLCRSSAECIDSLSQFCVRCVTLRENIPCQRHRLMQCANAYLTVKDCLKAKDVVEWAVKINGGTFDGMGAIAAVKVPTSRDVMQSTVFPQIRLFQCQGLARFSYCVGCVIRERIECPFLMEQPVGSMKKASFMIVSQFLFEVLKPFSCENC